MIHLAILHEPYIEAILSGRKTIESRLSLRRRPPWGVIEPGHTIYFKQRSGPVRLRATAACVDCHQALTPRAVDALARAHARAVAAPRDYWRKRRHARYATLIWLADVEPVDTAPPSPPMYGRGWQVLTRPASSRAA